MGGEWELSNTQWEENGSRVADSDSRDGRQIGAHGDSGEYKYAVGVGHECC
jgi:hypothetical protein